MTGQRARYHSASWPASPGALPPEELLDLLRDRFLSDNIERELNLALHQGLETADERIPGLSDLAVKT
jgi:hypothetical protein